MMIEEERGRKEKKKLTYMNLSNIHCCCGWTTKKMRSKASGGLVKKDHDDVRVVL